MHSLSPLKRVESDHDVQALSADARSGSFDVVLAEALDRISGDQEHMARNFKTLNFAGAHLATILEGEINEPHVRFPETMNGLRYHVMDPELFQAFSAAFVEEWNRATRDAEAARGRVARDLAKVQRKLGSLINALADGFGTAGLKEQMARLDAQRLGLVAKLAATDGPARLRLRPALP